MREKARERKTERGRESKRERMCVWGQKKKEQESKGARETFAPGKAGWQFSEARECIFCGG